MTDHDRRALERLSPPKPGCRGSCEPPEVRHIVVLLTSRHRLPRCFLPGSSRRRHGMASQGIRPPPAGRLPSPHRGERHQWSLAMSTLTASAPMAHGRRANPSRPLRSAISRSRYRSSAAFSGTAPTFVPASCARSWRGLATGKRGHLWLRRASAATGSGRRQDGCRLTGRGAVKRPTRHHGLISARFKSGAKPAENRRIWPILPQPWRFSDRG
jgi:hypothetical protein